MNNGNLIESESSKEESNIIIPNINLSEKSPQSSDDLSNIKFSNIIETTSQNFSRLSELRQSLASRQEIYDQDYLYPALQEGISQAMKLNDDTREKVKEQSELIRTQIQELGESKLLIEKNSSDNYDKFIESRFSARDNLFKKIIYPVIEVVEFVIKFPIAILIAISQVPVESEKERKIEDKIKNLGLSEAKLISDWNSKERELKFENNTTQILLNKLSEINTENIGAEDKNVKFHLVSSKMILQLKNLLKLLKSDKISDFNLNEDSIKAAKASGQNQDELSQLITIVQRLPYHITYCKRDLISRIESISSSIENLYKEFFVREILKVAESEPQVLSKLNADLARHHIEFNQSVAKLILSGHKILMIDNDPFNLQYYLKTLHADTCGNTDVIHYQEDQISNEQLAKRLELSKPDIILLDYELGATRTGLDLLPLIQGTLPDCRIIGFSSDPFCADNFREAGLPTIIKTNWAEEVSVMIARSLSDDPVFSNIKFRERNSISDKTDFSRGIRDLIHNSAKPEILSDLLYSLFEQLPSEAHIYACLYLILPVALKNVGIQQSEEEMLKKLSPQLIKLFSNLSPCCNGAVGHRTSIDPSEMLIKTLTKLIETRAGSYTPDQIFDIALDPLFKAAKNLSNTCFTNKLSIILEYMYRPNIEEQLSALKEVTGEISKLWAGSQKTYIETSWFEGRSTYCDILSLYADFNRVELNIPLEQRKEALILFFKLLKLLTNDNNSDSYQMKNLLEVFQKVRSLTGNEYFLTGLRSIISFLEPLKATQELSPYTLNSFLKEKVNKYLVEFGAINECSLIRLEVLELVGLSTIFTLNTGAWMSSIICLESGLPQIAACLRQVLGEKFSIEEFLKVLKSTIQFELESLTEDHLKYKSNNRLQLVFKSVFEYLNEQTADEIIDFFLSHKIEINLIYNYLAKNNKSHNLASNYIADQIQIAANDFTENNLDHGNHNIAQIKCYILSKALKNIIKRLEINIGEEIADNQVV